MKVVFILSDALRHDYVQYMPFIREMSQQHTYYERVIPGIGFCEISEYVSGISSINNGNLFQITFNGKFGRPKFRHISKLNSILIHIPRIRNYTSIMMDNYLLKHEKEFHDKDVLKVRYNIPLHLVDFFEPTESRHAYDSELFFPETNLFLELTKMGKTYDISDFVEHNKIKGTDEDRLDRLEEKIKRRKLKDFTLLYIGKGEIAHMSGTNDVEFHDTLTRYDSRLALIKKSLDRVYGDDYRFIILGDHGMVDVQKYINIMPIIKKTEKNTGLKVGLDYVYFIDSTAFRMWFKDKSKISPCDKILREFLKGDLDSLNIKDSKYGDLIYLLSPGKVFFPDFFNRKRNKGMHGYTNSIYEQHGQCLVIGTNDKKVYKTLDLTEARKLVIDCFDRSPNEKTD